MMRGQQNVNMKRVLLWQFVYSSWRAALLDTVTQNEEENAITYRRHRKEPVDACDDDIPFSFLFLYWFIPLQSRMIHINQPKALVLTKFIAWQ